jgi:hypothetical protein
MAAAADYARPQLREPNDMTEYELEIAAEYRNADLMKRLDYAAKEIVAALADSGHPDQVLEFVQPSGIGISAGDIPMAVFVVTGAAGTWFTKRWADEYLWPRMKTKIDEPSRRFVDWLLGQLGSKP